MLQKWTAELPISDNLEWCYNGKFYENLDGFSFFYRDSKCLIGLQFSKDGQLLYRAEEAMSKLDIPAYWMVSEQDPSILICGRNAAYRMDQLCPLRNPSEELFAHYRENEGHLTDDPFVFGAYRIEHTTSFGYRCVDLENQQILWKRSLKGYLYRDMLQIPGTNLILVCTAGHGGSIFAIDLPTGAIQYEIPTGGTRHIALSETSLYCYKLGKAGTLLKVELRSGTVLDQVQLSFTDINCPLWRTSSGEIIAFSRVKFSKSQWMPLLSCYTE